jgi:hypothetical protein
MQKELQKHVTSLDLSKKMKELGFPQESFFEYRLFDIGGEMVWSKPILTGSIRIQMGAAKVGFGEVSAYLASELGEWLHSIKIDLWQYHNDGKFLLKTMTHDAPDMNEATECDCRAKMLIWLAENNYLDPKSLCHNE